MSVFSAVLVVNTWRNRLVCRRDAVAAARSLSFVHDRQHRLRSACLRSSAASARRSLNVS